MTLRDERGMTLVELLVAMTMLIGALGASLVVLTTLRTTSSAAEQRAGDAQLARVQVDRLARQLRNLASPTYEQPQAVDKADPFDIVFQTVDPVGPNGQNATNVQRVRYCLEGATGRLWSQSQRWTTAVAPAAPATGACPGGTGWSDTRTVAQGVVNRQGGQDRPLFLFDTTVTTEISRVRVDLHVEDGPGSGVVGTRVQTGVFLRNQNRRPVASFTYTLSAGRHVLLNGSPSTDPEGEPLKYVWYDGTTKIGEGVTLDYAAPSSGTRTITLRVYDPALLEGVSAPQAVAIP
jgi:type II secretory pathway pseudopilin PulG